MQQYENDIEQYLDEIAQILPATEEEQDRFLTRMEESIAQYEIETGAEANYDGLVAYFGTPGKIAKEYAAVWEAERKASAVAAARNPWKKVVFWLCAAALLGCIALVAYEFFRASFAYGQDYMEMTRAG